MKNILIVEDEEAQRILYKEELAELGHKIRLAKDGEEALKLAEEKRPDLVILDIMMPGKNGLETLRELLNNDPRVPVIINTAYSHYKENFMSWAAEEYIVKSSDLTELKNAVSKLIS